MKLVEVKSEMKMIPLPVITKPIQLVSVEDELLMKTGRCKKKMTCVQKELEVSVYENDLHVADPEGNMERKTAIEYGMLMRGGQI